ncbi:tetratricopeptide repeat protein [Stieleria varia]|uniref:Uncharacterized protein n=1 Tax=Stieleria varia TaxID=2528005 RepID=A0A5C6B7Y3_9BACT|nr:protein-disulfide isomerase [Stieleria varia]TWU08183.1 hypothetical protein Pla52n_07650 [Stieleria varia]
MSVDQYSICPCGSGKKIKFCKCKDSVGELEKVLTMFEGGQLVPALDRLSNILQEHPDAAWALALRGRLLMDLREYDSLAENADRFIRLQPSNPLALTQRAAAKIFSADVSAATESLLEALNESGRNVDSFVMDVSSMLAMVLAQQGNVLSARVYAMLSAYAQGYDNEQVRGFLAQLDSAPSLNHRQKAVPAMIERPADADWGERFDEALSLLRSNKVLLAQTKFESLRRTVVGEPAVLSGLFLCAVWRADMQQQCEMLKQLSQCESLSFDERCRYRALAALTQPTDDIAIPAVELFAEIENADEVELALIASDRLIQLPPETARQFITSEEEVPPRSVFRLADRPKVGEDSELPAAEDIPVSQAIVLVYGRQTDRAACVEAIEVFESDVEEIKNVLTGVIGDVTWDSKPFGSIPFLDACESRPAYQFRKGSMEDIQAIVLGFMNIHLPKSVLTQQLPILGGRSLADTADDDSLLLERTTVVRIVESYEALASKPQVIAAIQDGAKVAPLPEIKLTNADVEEGVHNEDLFRVDTSSLGIEELWYILSQCQSIGVRSTGAKVAKQLIATDMSEDQNVLKLQCYMYWLSAVSDTAQAGSIAEEAIAFAKEKKLPFASLLMMKLELHLSTGDEAGFKSTIGEIDANYRNNPEVMAQLQQLLMRAGLIRPDGSLRQGSPAGPAPGASPAASSSSGLWTPDSPNPPAAGSPASGDGGSKLWVPGMD